MEPEPAASAPNDPVVPLGVRLVELDAQRLVLEWDEQPGMQYEIEYTWPGRPGYSTIGIVDKAVFNSANFENCRLAADSEYIFHIRAVSGPAVSEYSADFPIRTRVKAGNPLWVLNLTAPVVGVPFVAADGSIYFAQEDDRILSVDSDGQIAWSMGTDADVVFAHATSQEQYKVYSAGEADHYIVDTATGVTERVPNTGVAPLYTSLLPDGGSVTAAGEVLYLESPDYELIWTAEIPFSSLGSPAVTSDGSLIVGSNSSAELARFDREGNLVWHIENGGSHRIYELPSMPHVANDDTIVVNRSSGLDNWIQAYSPDGKLLWEIAGSEQFTRIFDSPDGSWYAYSFQGNLVKFGTDGNVLWKTEVGPNNYGNVQDLWYREDGIVVAVTATDNLVRINPSNGEVIDYLKLDPERDLVSILPGPGDTIFAFLTQENNSTVRIGLVAVRGGEFSIGVRRQQK